MISRCTRPANKSYANYGGRGIRVCKRWLRFENFIADVGLRPSSEYSLERRDNDLGYTPSNCYWATRSEQQKNRRDTRRYSDGVFTGTLVECADYLGISKALAYWRYQTWGSFQKDRAWAELPKDL